MSTRPLMATDLLKVQHAMNPASKVWPRWPDEIKAQSVNPRDWIIEASRRQLRGVQRLPGSTLWPPEAPVEILNRKEPS
jgi:hypothetical protein